MTKAELKRQFELQMESYMLHGGVVTTLKTYKARKNERTFRAIKGSVANVGRKVTELKLSGAKTRLRG